MSTLGKREIMLYYKTMDPESPKYPNYPFACREQIIAAATFATLCIFMALQNPDQPLSPNSGPEWPLLVVGSAGTATVAMVLFFAAQRKFRK